MSLLLRYRRRWSLSLVPVLLLVLAACGGPAAPKPPGGGTATLADNTTVLDEASLDALDDVANDGEYTFHSVTPTLADLAVGDVFIAGVSDATPFGALRRVDGVTPSGAGISLQTSQATLQDAFEELAVDFDGTVSALASARHPDLDAIRPQADGISFPINLSASGEDGSVTLTGAVSLAPSFDLTIDFDISSFSLDELSMEFGASQSLLADLTGSGTVSFEEGVTLGTIPFAPIILSIPYPGGILPVVLTPTVSVEAGLEGSASGSFAASVDQQASISVGLGYKDGSFGGFSDSDGSHDFDVPTYEAAVSARATVGPRLSVLLYGAVGPYASVEGYVAASASLDGPPPCTRGTLDAGLRATVGVSFLADYESTLLDKTFPLSSFDSCSNDPNAPRPAATWSRTFGRVGSPGEEARAVAQVQDGGYLVVGSSDLFGGITGTGASLWAMRLDALGNVLWQRAYGGAVFGGPPTVALTADDGFLVATRSGLLALDTGGNVAWVRNLSGDGYVEIVSAARAPNGDVVLAGRYGDTPSAWAASVAPTGEVRWSRTFAADTFARVRATDDGGFVLVGTRPSGSGDGYVVKLAADGSATWQRAIDNQFDLHGGEDDEPLLSSGGDSALDVVQRHDGSYVVVGYSYGAFPNPEPDPVGHYEAWVAELDATGEIVSSTVHRAPDSALYDLGQAVVALPNGTVVAFGQRADDADDLFVDEDVFMIKGGAYGVLGGAGNDSLRSQENLTSGASNLLATADGGILLAMTSDSFSSDPRFWLLKLGRTAGLGLPNTSSIPGTSHESESPTSVAVSATPVAAPLSIETGGPVQVESTAIAGDWQAP